MNKRLFFWLYNMAKDNKAVGRIAVFVASHTNKIYALVYLIGMVYAFFQNSNLLFRFILIPFITIVYNSILRKILNRPRPFKELEIESLIEHEDKGSCPSNHAVSAMIIAMAWCSIFPVVGAILVVLAVFTGISRVMTGVHYPIDVFLGWIIAIVIGSLGFFLF